ncbi:MAG TPA: hypothetical protein VF950_22960 [Planctomycetota bacterium]
MKLAIAAAFAALLAAAPAAAPVRYETHGIRVGDDLISGAALQLKAVDATTLLVSASAVENLGAAVRVDLDASHAVNLQPGLRLERRADGFTLASHGPALEAAGLALNGATSVAFTLTAKGFDFGPLGALEGASFTVTAAPAQDGIISPERRAAQMRGSRAAQKNRVFRGHSPLVPGAGADREILASLVEVSATGN